SSYFSMNSVWPCSSTQTPRGFVRASRSKTAQRSRVPPGVRMNRALNAPGAGAMELTCRLLQDGTKLHRQSHVAGDLQLALHEGGGAVEFALDHLVEGVERHRNSAVGGFAFAVGDGVRRGLAVDEDAARFAEIEFEDAAEAGVAADGAGHLRDDLLNRCRAHDRPSRAPHFRENLPQGI